MKKIICLFLLLIGFATVCNATEVTIRWNFDLEKEDILSEFRIYYVNMCPGGNKDVKILVWQGQPYEREATFDAACLYETGITPFYIEAVYKNRLRAISGPYFYKKYTPPIITTIVEPTYFYILRMR